MKSTAPRATLQRRHRGFGGHVKPASAPSDSTQFIHNYGIRVALCISLASLCNALTVRVPLVNLESLQAVADDTCEQYDMSKHTCRQVRTFFSMARFCINVAIPFGTHLQLVAAAAAFFLQLSGATKYQLLVASAQATAAFLQIGHVVAVHNCALCIEKAVAIIPPNIPNDNALKDVFRFTHHAVLQMFLVSLGAMVIHISHIIYTLRKVLSSS